MSVDIAYRVEGWPYGQIECKDENDYVQCGNCLKEFHLTTTHWRTYVYVLRKHAGDVMMPDRGKWQIFFCGDACANEFEAKHEGVGRWA